ncbi:unnamed protein product [Nezara viridula]|uniref:Uncharacterized protein n=1 Tax=Nezara viridula TaxID=85310 RepID=A0A9P0H1M5_NEZVI|nr:unnamed protein product [Nezara viridula]
MEQVGTWVNRKRTNQRPEKRQSCHISLRSALTDPGSPEWQIWRSFEEISLAVTHLSGMGPNRKLAEVLSQHWPGTSNKRHLDQSKRAKTSLSSSKPFDTLNKSRI